MTETELLFVKGRFVAYAQATNLPFVIVDAPHAQPPLADQWTGELARAIGSRAGCHCVVATVSRTQADLNRTRGPANSSAIDEYRATITRLLSDSGQLDAGGLARLPCLHLTIHGMHDEHGMDVEVGTRNGQTCAPHVATWVMEQLREGFSRLALPRAVCITKDRVFPGDPSKVVHRKGDTVSGYTGFGTEFHTIQIEFARWLRERHREELAQIIARVAEEFASTFRAA